MTTGPGDGSEIQPTSRVVVDGDLSVDKLRALIARSGEEDVLDYKASYSLGGSKSTREKLEVARDIIAMANTRGGYMVIGIDEDTANPQQRYIPNGLDPAHQRDFDADKLKAQAERYVSVSVEVDLAIHPLPEYGSRAFALIYVPEAPHSPIIMARDGQYHDPAANRSVTVFQQGDIIVRVGASSRKADQNAARELVSKIRRRERDQWTEEILGVRPLVERLDRLIALLEAQSTGAPAVAPQRPADTDFFLGMAAFEDLIQDRLAEDDDVGLRRYLRRAPLLFARSLDEAADKDADERGEIRDNRLGPLLDNLAVLILLAAEHKREDLVTEGRDALYDIYSRGKDPKKVAGNPEWVWGEVIKRVYTIGATLVRERRYKHAPDFIRQPVDWDDYWHDRFWARHAVTMLSQARLLDRPGLCSLAASFVQERPWLYERFDGEYENLINALCQFDFVQCIQVVHATEDWHAPYPSFAGFYNFRTEPIVLQLVNQPAIRSALIPDMDDQSLATIIHGLDQLAARQAFAISGWHSSGWSDKRIIEFLERNLPKGTSPG